MTELHKKIFDIPVRCKICRMNHEESSDCAPDDLIKRVLMLEASCRDLNRSNRGARREAAEATDAYDDLFETALRQLESKDFNALLCEKCEDAPRYTERLTVCRKCTPVEDDRDGEY